MGKYLVLCLAIFLCAACALKEAEPVWRGDGLRLAATYSSGGETMDMNLVVLRGDNPEARRLIILLSPFNNTVGDCILKNGRSQCRGSRPFAPLARRISGAVAQEIQRDSEFSRPVAIHKNTWSLTIAWPE